MYADLLNAKATEDDIAKLDDYFGYSINELKDIYSINNGDKLISSKGFFLGSFMGFEFLPIDRVISVHKSWKKTQLSSNYRGTSFPEGCIKPCYTNEKWIPIFGDSGGNYIGIDYDPDENGTMGQVINFGRDEDNKFVIANNLNAFLEFVKTQIENGTCDKSIVEEDEGRFSYGLTRQSHLIDDLRKLFGKNAV